MRDLRPTPVGRTDAVRTELKQRTYRHSTPQQTALRARIILAVADGLNHAGVAPTLDISLDIARLWRQRWLGSEAVNRDDFSIVDRPTDAPRSGKPVRMTDEQACQILELACEAPERSGRSISQWSERKIADEVRAHGIVEQISDRHAACLRKRGRSKHTGGAPG